jgi:hypothetical protein
LAQAVPAGLPALPRFGYVGLFLLGCVQSFFEAHLVTIEEPI